jgi:hypothetical protein
MQRGEVTLAIAVNRELYDYRLSQPAHRRTPEILMLSKGGK